jgi:hypothetical protein
MFKTRNEDRNKTVGHGTRQPRNSRGKPATVSHLRRVSRGQGETTKELAKLAKRRHRARR